MKQLINKYPVLTYLLLTFIGAWSIVFILIANTTTDMSDPGLGVILGGWILGFAPSVSAIFVTHFIEGGFKGSRLSQCLKKKSSFKLYILAIMLVPLYTLINVLLTHLSIVPYKIEIVGAMVILGLVWGIFSALGEELGWRGFLLPRLFERYSVFSSGLLVGIIWAIWHLPINYLGLRYYGAYMPAFMLVTSINLTLDALIITGLYVKGKGNIKLTMLYHYTLTGMTILQGGICQPIRSSYVDSLWSNAIGFVLKLIVIGILFMTIKQEVKVIDQSRSSKRELHL